MYKTELHNQPSLSDSILNIVPQTVIPSPWSFISTRIKSSSSSTTGSLRFVRCSLISLAALRESSINTYIEKVVPYSSLKDKRSAFQLDWPFLAFEGMRERRNIMASRFGGFYGDFLRGVMVRKATWINARDYWSSQDVNSWQPEEVGS